MIVISNKYPFKTYWDEAVSVIEVLFVLIIQVVKVLGIALVTGGLVVAGIVEVFGLKASDVIMHLENLAHNLWLQY